METSPIITEPEPSSQAEVKIKRKSKFPRELIPAILSGILMFLAHPSASLWPLAWIGLVPLLSILFRIQRPKHAFRLGYLFGWCYFAPVCYWTGLTIVGWTHSPIGWLALILLTFCAAWFYAFWALAAWWIIRSMTGILRILAIAASWTIMDWSRTVGTLSFPWAEVGYTQARVLPVIQIAEFTGSYGITFLVILVNALVAVWWLNRKHRKSYQILFTIPALLLPVCLFGAYRLLQPTTGKPITVAVMQSNFANREGRDETVEKMMTFQQLTAKAARSVSPPPSLYAWGESSSPQDGLHDHSTRLFLTELAVNNHAALLTGSFIEETPKKEYNSVLLFTPDGKSPSRYDKQGTVPFGEYIPFRNLIPESIQKQFQFFDSDLTQGEVSKTMSYTDPQIGPVSLGPFICYESVYPRYARTMTRLGANLLVTPSNDQWFQSESAMEQHLSIVIFRAIENRRDVARATTNGITCFVDSKGNILARAPLNTPTFLVHTLHLHEEMTFYTRFGDWFIGVCILLWLIGIVNNLRNHRNIQPSISKSSLLL